MSDVRDPNTDQALPTTNARPYIQDLVITDIETRKQHGIRKYGTALQSGNGRNMTQDAYEEALDLAIYLRGMLDEEERRECWWITTEVFTRGGKKVAGPFPSREQAQDARTTIEKYTRHTTFWIDQERAS